MNNSVDLNTLRHYIKQSNMLLSYVNLSLVFDILDSYNFENIDLDRDPDLWEMEKITELDIAIDSSLIIRDNTVLDIVKSKLIENFVFNLDKILSNYIVKEIPAIISDSHESSLQKIYNSLINFNWNFKGIPQGGPSRNELILYIHPELYCKLMNYYELGENRMLKWEDNSLMLYEYIMPDNLNMWGRDLYVPIHVSVNMPKDVYVLANKFNILFDIRKSDLTDAYFDIRTFTSYINFKATINYGIYDLKGIIVGKI